MLVTIILSVVFLILILVIIEDSRDLETQGIWSTVLLGVFLGILYFVKRDLLYSFVKSFDLVEFMLFFLGYLLIGVFWSAFKWWKYCDFLYNQYLEKKKRCPNEDINYYIPILSAENINRIGSWIFWWPFFLIRYLLADLLYNLRDKIVNSLAKVYDGITRSKFKE